MLFNDILTYGIKFLNNNVALHIKDAYLLLQYVANVNKERLIRIMYDEAPEYIFDHYRQLLTRRASGVSVAVIVGHKEFMDYSFATSNHTLDPRNDSETIIEAFQYFFPDKRKPIKFIDMGTGSGCLAITILKMYPNSSAVAIDISGPALTVAIKNANTHNVHNRLTFYRTSWQGPINHKYDAIIANPPYIKGSSYTTLHKDVIKSDPAGALIGGSNGMVPCKAILAQSNRILKKKKNPIIFEIGQEQKKTLAAIAHQYNLRIGYIGKDLQYIDRCIALLPRTSIHDNKIIISYPKIPRRQ